ncbi:MAG: PEGA domain-containing protein [Terriglobia bacterium]
MHCPTTAVNDTSGAVAVSTVPDGADISVDGNFVGSAPATLKLAAGKHVISVGQQGYKAWSRELSVLPGSSVTLKAALEKE